MNELEWGAGGFRGEAWNWTLAYEYAYSYVFPGRRERQWGLRSLQAPLGVFNPILYKDTNFPLRPGWRWRGGKLQHPSVFLNQTDRKLSGRNPRPYGDSHKFPQFHCLVGWLRIHHSTAGLPLNRVVKEQEGGRDRDRQRWKKKWFSFCRHNMTQITVDCPYLVTIKLPLCLKVQEWKSKQKAKWKAGLLQRLILYKWDQSIPSLRNRRKSISSLFPPSFHFYVRP